MRNTKRKHANPTTTTKGADYVTVLTIINCPHPRHDYLQLPDYIGHLRDYRAAVLRSREENMGKGKHFELTTMLSFGNSQAPWNAPFSKPINQCNPGIMFRRFPVPQK